MTTPPPSSDPIPAFAREVITLYTEAMPGVRFPDLDLEVLESAAAELRAALATVERATAELEAARNAAKHHSELLEARAERALSYARVFAEGDPLLSERIVALGRAKSAPIGQSAPVKKRGRPRKDAPRDTSLFEAQPADVVEGVDSAA